MTRRASRRTGIVFVAASAMLAGCVHTAGYELLSFIGLSEKPIVIALVAGMPKTPTNPIEAIDPFGPYVPLCKEMGAELGRPVVPDLCLPIQLEGNMQLGICQLASVSAIDYARLSKPDSYNVLAVSADAQGRAERSGLLVVRGDAPIQGIPDLKGKAVAFGPDRDARLNQAALRLLEDNGLRRTDLSLEALPLPGSLRVFAKSRDIAQSVANGSSDAGFVDEEYWDSLPEQPTGPGEPSRSRLRVIARTKPIAERLMIASNQVDAATRARISSFLTSLDEKRSNALKSLSCDAFVPPTEEMLVTCRSLAPGQAQTPSPQ